MSDAFAHITQRNRGSKLWAARKGIGSFVMLHMGERIRRQDVPFGVRDHGALHIWLYLCDWTIESRGRPILTSESLTENDHTLSVFEDRVFRSISLSAEGGVDISFSGQLDVRARSNLDVYDADDDLLIVFEHGQGVFGFSPMRGVYAEQG